LAFTYTDYKKTLLHTWGRFRVTVSEAVEVGDLLSWLNTGTSNTVQFADESDSQVADCIACEDGAAGDEIWACLKAECKSSYSVGTGGAVTQNYFAASTDYLGAPLYLSTTGGKPSSTVGSTVMQKVGRLLARDRILLDLTPADLSQTTFTVTLSGTTATNAVAATVTDSQTASTGYCRGMYVNYTVSGAHTGTAEVNPLAVDVSMQANVAGSVYCVSLYMEQSGDPTIGNDISGLYMYLNSKGSATYSGTYNCIDLNIDSTAKATGGNNFMRIYGHGATADNVMTILGHGATYLINFASTSTSPIAANTHAIDSHSLSGIITVAVAGAAFGYIPVFADVPA